MRRLRKNAPTDLPVEVVRRAMPARKTGDSWGYCIRPDGHYRIVLNSNIAANAQEEILLHEYAHAVAWPGQLRDEIKEVHDCRHYGPAYALVCRASDPPE